MRRTIAETQALIAAIKHQLDHFEIDKYYAASQYDDWLRGMYEDEGCTIIEDWGFDAATAFKKLDPCAYKVGLRQFISVMDPEEDTCYLDLTEELEELHDELEALEAEEEQAEEEQAEEDRAWDRLEEEDRKEKDGE